MSWLRIPVGGGVLKIKPRWQMRWAERHRQVRVWDLGVVVLSWWTQSDLSKY
jgi:hypothetical protein